MMRPDGETRDPADLTAAGSRHVWELALPYTTPPLTYNEMLGKHWSRVHRAREALHTTAFYLSRAAKMPRPVPFAVTVELIYWPGNNTVHDPDNMGPTLKYLVDGLRIADVLTDDRGKYVRSAICTVIERADDPEDRADPRMVLRVCELESAPPISGVASAL